MRAPPKANAARAGGGAAKDVEDVNYSELLAHTSSDLTSNCGSNTLIAQLDAARDRIDRASDLINQSFDLRESLHFGIDVDAARAMVAGFKRDCRAWQQYPEAGT